MTAAQRLRDDWVGRPFSWDGGHCIRMLADHLRRMGYKPPLSRAGSFKTALGARRAMRNAGVETLSAAVDLLKLPRIAPAAAIAGDIIELPGEEPFGCMTVAMGNGRVLGAHVDVPDFTILQPLEYVAAWRVEPVSLSGRRG